jgi:hypothetical protein
MCNTSDGIHTYEFGVTVSNVWSKTRTTRNMSVKIRQCFRVTNGNEIEDGQRSAGERERYRRHWGDSDDGRWWWWLIRRKRIYHFWCSMLVLHQFALCFVYTLCHFFALSGTNLLMRCHSASSCFLLYLCFRKVTQEFFSELDEMKAEVPIYLTRRHSRKESRRGARGQPHHRVAWATLAAPPGGVDPWYVSNVSIIFDDPCLFLHHLPTVSLHFGALLCIFRN